jgi:hypothetical protein
MTVNLSNATPCCPKCTSLQVRDWRRTPLGMGIWVGLLALPFSIFAPEAYRGVVLIVSVLVAAIGSYAFYRLARNYAAQFDCTSCPHRWRKSE